MDDVLWRFTTGEFTVVVDAIDEDYPDLSWDQTGEVREKINSGEYVVFCARARLLWNGIELATDYLGDCIYSNPKEFVNHRGTRGQYGSYFKVMVSNVITEGRKALCNVPKLRCVE